jgi:hypothetical protein
LFDLTEIGQATKHPKITSVTQHADAAAAVPAYLAQLADAVDSTDAAGLRQILLGLVSVDGSLDADEVVAARTPRLTAVKRELVRAV